MGRYWFAEFEVESDIYGLLYFDWSWPETIAQRIDDAGAIACLIAALVIMAPTSRLQQYQVGHFQRFAAGFVAAWMFALAAAQMVRGGKFAELMLFEHAVRYTAPLALLFVLGASDSIGSARLRACILILLVASSVTFIVHGYKATQHHGPFSDLVLLTDVNWGSSGISQSTVEKALWGIGVADIVIAVLIWIPRMPIALVYMVIWGMLTAASRMTAMGASAWPDTLIRSANWGCPLAIAIYFFLTKSKPSTTVP